MLSESTYLDRFTLSFDRLLRVFGILGSSMVRHDLEVFPFARIKVEARYVMGHRSESKHHTSVELGETGIWEISRSSIDCGNAD